MLSVSFRKLIVAVETENAAFANGAKTVSWPPSSQHELRLHHFGVFGFWIVSSCTQTCTSYVHVTLSQLLMWFHFQGRTITYLPVTSLASFRHWNLAPGHSHILQKKPYRMNRSLPQMSVEVHMHRHVRSFPNKPLSLAGARFGCLGLLFYRCWCDMPPVGWTQRPTILTAKRPSNISRGMISRCWNTHNFRLIRQLMTGRKKQEPDDSYSSQPLKIPKNRYVLPQRVVEVPGPPKTNNSTNTPDHIKHITFPTPKNPAKPGNATSPFWRLKPTPVAPCSVKAAKAPPLACSCCTLETWLDNWPPEAKSSFATSHTGDVGVSSGWQFIHTKGWQIKPPPCIEKIYKNQHVPKWFWKMESKQ